MSDTLPSAPVAATVPSALQTAVTTLPAPAPPPVPTAAPVVKPTLPEGQYRAIVPLDYTVTAEDGTVTDVHLEAGEVAEIPADKVLALAAARLIEPDAIDASPAPAADPPAADPPAADPPAVPSTTVPAVI